MTTSNRGTGIAPFGTSPFGFGAPAEANPNVGKAYNTAQNTQGTGRFINPETRDYQFDANTGRLIGQNSAQQMVYLALVTEKGSSAVLGLGEDYTLIKTVSPDIQALVETSVKNALKSLTDRKIITLDQVILNLVKNKRTDPNRLMRISVRWTDLNNNTSFETII